MKTCSKCFQEKPLSEFYKRSSGKANRYQTYCRRCWQDQGRALIEANRERHLARRREASATEEFREQKRRHYRNNGRKRYDCPQDPIRVRARILTNNAIRAGRLVRGNCESCGSDQQVEAHHEDYSKPLDVAWLCRVCHGARHREINAESRRAAAE